MKKGTAIYLVVYDAVDNCYACAFSDRQVASAFADMVDGRVIETYVDIHADLIERGGF